jgi:hypothetical protein
MSQPRKLKYHPGFKECIVNEEDEIYRNGFFHFNISRLQQYIDANPEKFSVVEIKISDYIAFSKINESHIDGVDNTKPVIIAEIAPQRYNLIDGNHRAVKAHRQNHKTIKAYQIKMEEHIPFLISHEMYKKYVNYWNSKL